MGYVDVRAILTQSSKVAEKKAALEADFQTKHEAISAQQDKIQQLYEEIKKNEKTYSKSDLDAKHAELSKLQEALQTDEMNFQSEVIQAQNTTMDALMSDINAAAASVAKDKGYAVVLAKQDVLYAESTDDDLTASVQSIFDGQ